LYYCVDDFSAWPGLDGPTLRDMEIDLLHGVDAVVAVSQPLAQRAAAAGHEPVMITHGVDAKFWQAPAVSAQAVPMAEAIGASDGPRALFWGLVDERLDQPLIRALARRVGSLWLVGPHQGDIDRLRQMDRVHMPGPVDYQDLPHLAEAADLLIMPYADRPVTRAMQPLKLLEYLATDKPVICSDLPALRPWADACDVAGRHAFVDRAMRRAEQGPSPSQLHARQRRLVYESWEAKAAEMESVLESLTRPRRRGPDRRAA
jgi:glycosyltransferase involved in cell wall biosynthesis